MVTPTPVYESLSRAIFLVKPSTGSSGAPWLSHTFRRTSRLRKAAFKQLSVKASFKNWVNYQYRRSVIKCAVSEAKRAHTTRRFALLSARENLRAAYRYLKKLRIAHNNFYTPSIVASEFERRRKLRLIGLELESRFHNSLPLTHFLIQTYGAQFLPDAEAELTNVVIIILHTCLP